MRVLIIVENFPVPLDRRVWQEARALRDAGHDVTVICPKMHGYTAAYEVLEGITIRRHWISQEANGIIGFISEYTSALVGEMWCALQAWRTKGFDVVHLCNPPDLLFLVAAPFKWLGGVKIIYDVHDLWPEMFEAKFQRRGFFYWAVRLAERCTLALADVVIATNQSVRDKIQQRSDKTDDEVFVVRTAPDRLNTDAPEDVQLKNGRRYLVGYIGIMGNADGLEYILQAARYIKDKGRHDVQFLLMGRGPEYDNLVKQRDELGLQDEVTMPGRVSNEFLFTVLQTMDIGVASDPINDYNNHCTMNKTLEYMAFGKPQVMFGTHEGRVSAGEAACYVMENSAEKLGDAILDLLDDEPTRKRMGVEARRRLHDELGWERSVRELYTAYDAVEVKQPA